MDWLKTVTELTDPMVARQAIEDAELLDALDFEIACESKAGYCPSEPHAAHYIYHGPCAHAHRPVCVVCRDNFLAVAWRGWARCDICGDRARVAEMRFDPIGNP